MDSETIECDYISILSMLAIYDDLVKHIRHRLCESIELHVDIFHDPNYEEVILEYAYDQILCDVEPLYSNFISVLSNKHVADVDAFDHLQYSHIINEAIALCMEEEMETAYEYSPIPQRHYFMEYNPKHPYYENRTRPFKAIDAQIKYLNSIPQPPQRTQEWYDIRNTCITASAAWKVLDSEKQRASLVKEKALALIESKNSTLATSSSNYATNVNSPFHWGHKYEPLSVLLYEYFNATRVGEYGCLKHSRYPFIGASPDGINIEPSSHKYGTLLEIKNVVSRDITGIPKKEYWTQMQMQMEVCDLDFCDFLETKFTEYEYEEDFYDDINIDEQPSSSSSSSQNKLLKNRNKEYVGMMVMFNKDNEPSYEYCPLGNNSLMAMEQWKKATIERVLQDDATFWVRDIYWKCEVYNCVCVERNKHWFNANIASFSRCWDEIQACVDDEQRAQALVDEKQQKKNDRDERKKKEFIESQDLLDRGNIGICLIKLD